MHDLFCLLSEYGMPTSVKVERVHDDERGRYVYRLFLLRDGNEQSAAGVEADDLGDMAENAVEYLRLFNDDEDEDQEVTT